MTAPLSVLRRAPDAERVADLGLRCPLGRCGALTVHATRCKMPGEVYDAPVSLCPSHRCRAVEGVRLHAIGTDGWIWRIG